MRFCGIDENGLGPFLGPLIITSYEAERVSDVQIIKDSKKVFSRKEKDFEFIERFFINEFGEVRDLYDLFEKSESSQVIRSICPFSPETFCFSKIKIPVWTNFPISVKKSRPNISFILACPGLLHLKVRDFGTKFRANAYFLCILALKSESQMVFCGKSGYKKSYLEELERAMLDIGIKTQTKVVKESDEVSIYEIKEPSKKRIHFIKDADLKFPEVAYASIIGKYLRELCMLSMTRFAFQDSRFPISGYGSKKKMNYTVKRILDNLRTRFGIFDEETAKKCLERNY